MDVADNTKIEANFDDEEELESDDDVTQGWREDDSPLGPPVGADAEATKLAEAVSVEMPGESKTEELLCL